MTMNLTADRTLAEVVTTSPASARVLESYGLDYCCGGHRRLDEACASAGIDPGGVLGALASVDAGPEPDWASMDPAELVDHLVAVHHAYLHTELGRLDALVEKVVGVHGDRHPELHDVRGVYQELRADLEPHLAKEERVLFPMIRELVNATVRPDFQCGSLQNPISVLMTEHDRVGELLSTLRALTNGYETPDDGCASYRALSDGLAELEADTHLHVHKENNVLFPAVVALEREWSGSDR
jgi:regulator of cell morphogenesis and NO signaling